MSTEQVAVSLNGVEFVVRGPVNPGSWDPRQANPSQGPWFSDPAIWTSLPDETGSRVPVDVTSLLASIPTGRGTSWAEVVIEQAEGVLDRASRACGDIEHEDYFRWEEGREA